MFSELNVNVPLQPVNLPLLLQKQITLKVLRLDLVHPVVSGNKWFKLVMNLEQLKKEGKKKLLTFGGAYSNHLVATAYAAKLAGVCSIGVVRGKEAEVLNSPTLCEARDFGMKFLFISREDYKRKYTPEFISELKEQFGNFYLVPEGGANLNGILGSTEIWKLIKEDCDIMATACGTATTLGGLYLGAPHTVEIIGFPVLKGGEYLKVELCQRLKQIKPEAVFHQLTFCSNYHFGGFGKHTQELITFMNDFYNETQIPLDFVYNAKMMFGLLDLVKKDNFKPQTRIIAIHSGGLQGNRTIKGKLVY